MARYRYAGPGPHDATMVGGGITRPGDEAEFEKLPEFGPWELLGDAAAAAADPVPVKEQLAAGIPPEATVTIADQKAGIPPPPIPAPPAPDAAADGGEN
jgi:hypothetical protein